MNLAAGRKIKILSLAELVNNLVGNNADIEFKPRKTWDTKKEC